MSTTVLGASAAQAETLYHLPLGTVQLTFEIVAHETLGEEKYL